MSDPAMSSESDWDSVDPATGPRADPLTRHADLARNTDLARNINPRIGMAYAVQLRTDPEPRSSTSRKTPALQSVLSFRLRRVGPGGELLPPVAVEMRGARVSGTITDGDLVQLPKTAPHGGALKLAAVTNLTTGSPVSSGTPRATRILTAIVAILLGLVAAGLVLIVIFLIPLTAEF